MKKFDYDFILDENLFTYIENNNNKLNLNSSCIQCKDYWVNENKSVIYYISNDMKLNKVTLAATDEIDHIYLDMLNNFYNLSDDELKIVSHVFINYLRDHLLSATEILSQIFVADEKFTFNDLKYISNFIYKFKGGE